MRQLLKKIFTPILEGSDYVVKHSIVKLYEENYVREFFAIGFEKINDKYHYAVFNDNIRSVFEVANLAMNKYQDGTIESSEKDLFDEKMDVLNNFINKGFDFVYSDVKVKNSYIGADDYEVFDFIHQEGKENIDLSSQLHPVCSVVDTDVATLSDGKITPLTFGETEITYSIGGIKNITKTLRVFVDEAQATLSNNATNSVVYNNDGTISLPFKTLSTDDSIIGNSRTLGTFNSDYVAFVGDYGVGNAFDIEFMGNNMPILKVLADKINTRLSCNDGKGNDDGYAAGVGALIFNGTSEVGALNNYNLIKDTYEPLIIGDNIFSSAGQMSYGYIGSKGFMNYGSTVPEFLQNNLALAENVNQKYKYTVAFSEFNGTKYIEVFFYKDVNGIWEYVNQISTSLTFYDDIIYGTNIIIMPGWNGLESTTIKVSLPYRYTKTDGVYTTGNTKLVHNPDGTYNFELTSMYDKLANHSNTTLREYGYNSYTTGHNYIAFDGNYGIGTYIDIEETVVKINAGFPKFNVQLFAQDMKGKLNTSGLLYTYIVPRTASSSSGTRNIFFSDNGINTTDNSRKWDLSTVVAKDRLNADTNFSSLIGNSSKMSNSTSARGRFTIGTYVDNEGYVCIDLQLTVFYYGSGNIVSTWAQQHNTGIKEENWFDAGGIIITPSQTTLSTSPLSISNLKCKIYQKEQV